jgi:hypothetical protein
VRTSGVRVEIPRLSSKARNGTEDCGLHHRHAVSHLLVVMDVLGPATPVTLYRTYRRIRWARQSSVVWKLRRPSSRGHQCRLPMHPVTLVSPVETARALTPSHSLGEVRPDRLTAIHFRCQTRSGPVQDKNPLGGNRGSVPGPKGLASSDRRSVGLIVARQMDGLAA